MRRRYNGKKIKVAKEDERTKNVNLNDKKKMGISVRDVEPF